MNTAVFSRYGSIRTKGFAVLEALIAFVVLATGLLALLSFHGASLEVVSDTRMRAEASALSEAKLQEIQSYLTVSDPRIAGSTNDCDTPSSQFSLYGDYYRCWEIDTNTPLCISEIDPDDRVCQVTAKISVFWDDRRGDRQVVEIVSMINVKDPTRGIRDFMSYALLTWLDEKPPVWMSPGQDD